MWRDQALFEFSRLLPTDTPKYLSTDFDERVITLRRETGYLFNKAQEFAAKLKATKPKVPIHDKRSTKGIKFNYIFFELIPIYI
jgi:hypothetical protein